MRYFLLILLLLVAGVVGVAGFRGQLSRKPPLEVFDDMKRQPKLRPQKPFALFEDERSSRLQTPGTIARGQRFEDLPVNTGCITGTTNFVATIPVPITAELLARGQERFAIFCAPCHSASGDGNGITSKYGMIRAGNFHDPR
ncbi:MAG: cytochrome c, partial [Verrucomicrobia bacterium]|nr:cytochrome c [Verrucomicrobiota bacterium]